MRISEQVKDIYKNSRSMILNIVEKYSMMRFLIFYAFVVVICGTSYTLLSKYSTSNGLTGGSVENNDVSFFDGLYFSIVSITTLGYGDIAPVGISRAIVILQTLFGIIMIGVIISKFTSIRLSHQVKRLFISTTVSRIKEEISVFDNISNRLNETIPRVQEELVITPGKKVRRPASEIRIELDSLFLDFKIHSKKMHDFLVEETLYYNFVEEIPAEEYSSLVSSISKALESLLQFMISYSNFSNTGYLSNGSIKNYFQIVENGRLFMETISKNTATSGIKDKCAKISEICDELSSFSLVLPDIDQDLNQPDQKISIIDTPQI